MLLVRLQEIAALGELQKVSKSEVFLKSAGTSVVNVGKGVGKAVTDPVETVEGIGAGIRRFGVNLGRKSKRAAESVTDDDEKDGKSTGEKTAGAAEGAAYSIFGVTGAQRRWAQKVGVDPYSSNKVLRDALQGIGKVDAAGGIAAKVAVPIPMVVTTTASVSNLVWGKDPEEIRKLLEKQITELGASKEVSAAFFKNKVMTPTHWVRTVTALYAVKAKGSADYIDTAADAKSEREAVFLSESAVMLQKLHAESPVEAILTDTRIMIANDEGRSCHRPPSRRLLAVDGEARSRIEGAGRAGPHGARGEVGGDLDPGRSLAAGAPGAENPGLGRAREDLRAVSWTRGDGGSRHSSGGKSWRSCAIPSSIMRSMARGAGVVASWASPRQTTFPLEASIMSRRSVPTLR